MKLSFLEQLHNSPSITSETEKKALECFAPMYNLYDRAVRDGAVEDHPVPLVRTFVFDPIMSLARIHLNQELQIDEGILEKALDMAWNTIKI